MKATSTTSKRFFEGKYRLTPDPWNFSSSAYEQRRYQAILNALGTRRYRRAFEPGCSIGVLTARLAAHCNDVEALDISPTAVRLASERCKDLAHVRFTCASLAYFEPTGSFDLIVFNEIGYYFDEEQLAKVAKDLVSRLTRDGTFLAAHWLGVSPDHVLSGDRVHEILSDTEGLSHRSGERHAFRLDRWERQ